MKVEKILEYQKLDSEMYRIEKQLKNNQNKQAATELYEKMKNAQSHSYKLEEKAKALLSEIDKVKKQYKIQEDKIEEFLARDVNKMTKDELNRIDSLKDKLNQNLQILEKNLTSLAENVNAVLSEFNKTIKTFNSAKEEYAEKKQAFDNDVKAVEIEKNKFSQKLQELSKSIETNIMEAYLKRRKENVFPVVVPLNHGNSCGGCHTELSVANLTKLHDEGIISCEHCRRIIYVN